MKYFTKKWDDYINKEWKEYLGEEIINISFIEELCMIFLKKNFRINIQMLKEIC